jgi:hypothetical protein
MHKDDATQEQNEALETIMQGGTPDIPKTVHVPTDIKAGGQAYEDPEQDEDGIYEHRPVDAEEGDKWYGDDGKVWEMGAGGPIKVSMFDSIRTPMFCPDCEKIMNGKFDTKFYRMRGKCMDCVQKEETRMKVEGTYELYEKRTMLENKKSWLRDIKEGLEEFEEEMTGNVEQVVNSSGDTVEFGGLPEEDINEMMENAKDYIESFEQHVEELEQEVERLREETDANFSTE